MSHSTRKHTQQPRHHLVDGVLLYLLCRSRMELPRNQNEETTMSYDHIEIVLAEIIVEVTGEPRIGRFERSVAKNALARLRECGMSLPDIGAP